MWRYTTALARFPAVKAAAGPEILISIPAAPMQSQTRFDSVYHYIHLESNKIYVFTQRKKRIAVKLLLCIGLAIYF